MAYRARRSPARRTTAARRSYGTARRTGSRSYGRRNTGSRRTATRQPVIKLVIQSGPSQAIADPGTTAIAKKAGKSRF